MEVANRSRMVQQRNEVVSFDTVDSGDNELQRDLARQVLAPAWLELKVGAPVILLQNMTTTSSIAPRLWCERLPTRPTPSAWVGRVVMRPLARDLARLGDVQGNRRDKRFPVVGFAGPDSLSRMLCCVPSVETKNEGSNKVPGALHAGLGALHP